MDAVIISMLQQYSLRTDEDYENALKEIMQQVALLGLWRSKFFEHAAFYGGTALRILYKLDRFSEDLDFSLLKANANFSLAHYCESLEAELSALGFTTAIHEKVKSERTAIHSAFLKANTQALMLQVGAPEKIQQRYHRQATLKIKLEVDVEPPPGFNTETLPVLNPIPFWVKSYAKPDLFAGKISAVLCRQWKNRVKGRDWYDLLWFVQNQIPVHLSHLEARLRSFGYYQDREPLTEMKLKQLLFDKVQHLDIRLAKRDIEKFIKNPTDLDSWSQALFSHVVSQIAVL